jgi:hypothetical protein
LRKSPKGGDGVAVVVFCLLRGAGGSQRRNATTFQLLVYTLIAKQCLTSGTAPYGHGYQFERYHSFANGQCDDIADGDGQATLLHPATVDADMTSLHPILAKSPALGKSQKEQKFIDPQFRPNRLEF